MNNESIIWWFNLTYIERCNFREWYNVDIMTPELIDKIYLIYSKNKQQ